MGLGLVYNSFDRSNAMLALSGILKFSVKNIPHLRTRFFFNVPFLGDFYRGSVRFLMVLVFFRSYIRIFLGMRYPLFLAQNHSDCPQLHALWKNIHQK